MKDDLTQQLQQAEAQVAELRQQQHNSTAAAESQSADMEADAHAQADATALAHAEHLLSQSQAQIAQLQAERQELQAQITALQHSSHHVNGARHPVHAVVILAPHRSCQLHIQAVLDDGCELHPDEVVTPMKCVTEQVHFVMQVMLQLPLAHRLGTMSKPVGVTGMQVLALTKAIHLKTPGPVIRAHLQLLLQLSLLHKTPSNLITLQSSSQTLTPPQHLSQHCYRKLHVASTATLQTRSTLCSCAHLRCKPSCSSWSTYCKLRMFIQAVTEHVGIKTARQRRQSNCSSCQCACKRCTAQQLPQCRQALMLKLMCPGCRCCRASICCCSTPVCTHSGASAAGSRTSCRCTGGMLSTSETASLGQLHKALQVAHVQSCNKPYMKGSAAMQDMTYQLQQRIQDAEYRLASQGADASSVMPDHGNKHTPSPAAARPASACQPSPVSAETSLTGLSPSPFHASEAHTNATPAPKASEPAFNPLFDDRNGASPEPAAPYATPSKTIDAEFAAANGVHDAHKGEGGSEPALQQYLSLVQQLVGRLQSSAGHDRLTTADIDTLDAAAEPSSDDAKSGQSEIQGQVREAETQLLGLCNRLSKLRGSSGQQSASHRQSASIDIMRSLSGSFVGSPTNSPSHSSMSALGSIVTLLLDTHKKQLRALEKHVRSDTDRPHQHGSEEFWTAATALKTGFRELKGKAEEVREELKRLQEVSSQQESEVAIQWNEKHALQQQAHAQLASVQQVRAREAALTRVQNMSSTAASWRILAPLRLNHSGQNETPCAIQSVSSES